MVLGNPLKCDCYVRRLKDAQTFAEKFKDVVCNSPSMDENLNGINVTQCEVDTEPDLAFREIF